MARTGAARGCRGRGHGAMAGPGARGGGDAPRRAVEPGPRARWSRAFALGPRPRRSRALAPGPRLRRGQERELAGGIEEGGLEGPTSTAATAPGSAGASWARTRAGRFGRRKRRWAPLTGGPGGWGGLGRARLRVWGGAAARWWAAGWAAGVRDAGGSGGGSRALDGPGKPLGWRAGGKGGAGWAFFCFSFLFLDLLFFPILSTISNRISY
jgi:hypothetical protein